MTIEEVQELKKEIDIGGWATEDDVLELIKLVERLKKEREWLIERSLLYWGTKETLGEQKEKLEEIMQQELGE